MKKLYVVKRIVNRELEVTRVREYVTWDIYKRGKDSHEFVAEFVNRNEALIASQALNG